MGQKSDNMVLQNRGLSTPKCRSRLKREKSSLEMVPKEIGGTQLWENRKKKGKENSGVMRRSAFRVKAPSVGPKVRSRIRENPPPPLKIGEGENVLGGLRRGKRAFLWGRGVTCGVQTGSREGGGVLEPNWQKKSRGLRRIYEPFKGTQPMGIPKNGPLFVLGKSGTST